MMMMMMMMMPNLANLRRRRMATLRAPDHPQLTELAEKKQQPAVQRNR
jgi:hypothetical protein